MDVSRQTFTSYFCCKEEAIASLSADRFTQAVQAVATAPARRPGTPSWSRGDDHPHRADWDEPRGREHLG